MRRSLPLLAACVALTACLPATAATRSFSVPGFEKLRVEGPWTVRVHSGPRVAVTANGPQARLDRLIVENRGGTLVITSEKSWNWSGISWTKNDNVVIDVTVPTLSAAELTGSGELTIDQVKVPAFAATLTGSGDFTVPQLQTGKLTASITGSGDMTLVGRAESATATVRGSGDFHGAGLTANMADVSVTGSGDLAMGAARTANASVTGSGDISIAGHPRCTTRKTGSGDIRCG
jgi:hypothetical protein